MNLPQEIVETLIDQFAGDPDGLRSCSCISRRWRHRSQHHLFSRISISFSPHHHFKCWPAAWQSQAGDHIHSLRLDYGVGRSQWITQKNLTEICLTFPNTKSLTLVNPNLDLYGEFSFGPFKNSLRNLTSLSIENAESVYLEKLFNLICIFPTLDNLTINRVNARTQWACDPPAGTSPKFKGTLTVVNMYQAYCEPSVIRSLTRLPVAFAEVHFKKSCLKCESFAHGMNDLFYACRETVKKVEIGRAHV